MRLGKLGALAAIVLGIFASVVAFGYFYPYWRKADQDMVLAYQGLLFNDGAGQNYFDHTGYIYYLLIGAWYWLLHLLGLLPVDTLSSMPPASDVGPFEAAWTNLVRAGRMFSALFASFFVLTFAAYARALWRDGRIVVVAAFLIATSGSFMMHARIMRTEMLSAFFTTAVLAMTLLAAQEQRRARQAVMLAIAGLCAVLAMETKVQALIPLMTFPAIVLLFGVHKSSENKASWRVPAAMAALALFTVPAATHLIWRGLAANPVVYPALGPLPDGFYQALILAWPIAAIAAFAVIWRRGFTDAAIAAIALSLGASLGVLALLIRFEPHNVGALTHPVEHMLAFASNTRLGGDGHIGAGGGPVSALGLLADIGGALFNGVGAHTFFLNPNARPTLLAEWFAIAAGIVAWRRGERTAPLRAAALIGAAWVIDSIFALRGIKDSYLIYTDPLLIMAAATMLARFPEVFDSRRARGWAIGLAVVAVVWAHVEPIKLAFSKRGADNACGVVQQYLPAMRFPFCRS
jgi:hypothetical protein